MKPHTKVYFNYFGYGEQDTMPCEICGNIAVDIHHIYLKGMGGRKTFDLNDKTYDIDDIINLIALCRPDHDKAHKNEHSKDFLIFAHKCTIQGIVFEADRHKNRK